MKFRASRWLDTGSKERELPVRYGIQANSCDGNGWIHVGDKDGLLLFDTIGAVSGKIDELRKKFKRQRGLKKCPSNA